MANVFFVSDTHFSHAMVAEIRGFESIEAHDEHLIEAWNAVVTKRDHVWHLGDLTLKNPTAIEHLVNRLNGIKHLVLGNHDRAHPIFKNSHNALKKYAPMFETVQLFARRRISGKEVLLSHYPYSGDHGEDRHLQFRLRDTGISLLHGHTHANNVLTLSTPLRTPQVHVGVDTWGRPVAQEEVYAWL